MGCGWSSSTAQSLDVNGNPPTKDSSWDQDVQNDVSSACKAAPSSTAPKPAAAAAAPLEAGLPLCPRLLASVFAVPLAGVCVVGKPSSWIGGGEAAGGPMDVQLRQHQHLITQHLQASATMGQAVVVHDALLHKDLKGCAFVTRPPHIRFLAGMLVQSASSGGRAPTLGALFVVDTQPRTLDASQLASLSMFASLVTKELTAQVAAGAAARGPALEPADSTELPPDLLERAASCEEGMLVLDTARPSWPVLYANAAWPADTGVAVQEAISSTFWELFKPYERSNSLASGGRPSEGGDAVRQIAHDAVSSGKPACLQLCVPHENWPLKVWLQPVEAGSGADDNHAVQPTAGAPVLGMYASGELCACNISSAGSSVAGPSTPSSGRFCIVKAKRQGRGANISAQSSLASSYPSASPASPRGLSVPDTFSELELGPLIGKGSYGRVHKAVWRGVAVACKIIDSTGPSLGGSGGLVKSKSSSHSGTSGSSQGKAPTALLEAVLSKDLSHHPNIVQTFDFATRSVESDEEGRCQMQRVIIVQQYCNRGTLGACMKKGWLRKDRQPGAPPNPSAVLQTAQEIASAMAYLHSQGIIHGDLTPQNVLLTSSTKDTRRFTALVSDFGLSRAVEPEGRKTYSFGTVTYMPRELLTEGLLTFSSDVYSFGVLLYEMWMGRPAFDGFSAVQALNSISTGTAQLVLPHDAHPGIKALCESCLSSDHTRRPTFQQVLHVIAALLQSETAAASQQGGIAKRDGGSKRTPAVQEPTPAAAETAPVTTDVQPPMHLQCAAGDDASPVYAPVHSPFAVLN